MTKHQQKPANGYAGLLGLLIVLAIIVVIIFLLTKGNSNEERSEYEVAPQTAVEKARQDLSGVEETNKEANQDVEDILSQ